MDEDPIDKITGQKESEIPVAQAYFPPTQNHYFVLSKCVFYNNVWYQEEEEVGVKIIGIYSDGLQARNMMDREIMNHGWRASQIRKGTPEYILIECEERNNTQAKIEYKIELMKVDESHVDNKKWWHKDDKLREIP